VFAATPGRLPAETLEAARSHLLDTLGICLAATELDTSRAITAYATSQGGRFEAHAIGVEQAMPAALAALVNGTLAHSLDYDDTHLPSVLHPSASIVPACLAAAEMCGADGNALLAAIAAGTEVCVRIGMAGYDRAGRNSVYFDRGQHATSMCGAIGAAAAVAQLMGCGQEIICNAMAIAASMASGIIEANRAGGSVKRLHCGWAAHSAVTAASLAGMGFTGPPSALEGRFGFFNAFLSGRYVAEEITADLGESWVVSSVHFKPYPANHFTHAGIDAALAMRARGLRLDDIERIRLGVAGPTVRTIGEPIELKRNPETAYQAQFSGPYTVVAAFCGGSGLGVGLDDFTDELARSPERRRHMAKVEVFEDAACSEAFPDSFPAVLEVLTSAGQVETERVDANRGGPLRPLSNAELELKFADNARRVRSEACVSRMREAVAALGRGASVAELMASERS
jgi:2-methylcitrate dehydratase PrpD